MANYFAVPRRRGNNMFFFVAPLGFRSSTEIGKQWLDQQGSPPTQRSFPDFFYMFWNIDLKCVYTQ